MYAGFYAVPHHIVDNCHFVEDFRSLENVCRKGYV